MQQLLELTELGRLLIEFPVRLIELALLHKLLSKLSYQVKGSTNQSELEFSVIIEFLRHHLLVLKVESQQIHVQKSKVPSHREASHLSVQSDLVLRFLS